MHYSYDFNHFHIHPLYHRHYLQSPRQSNYHNLLVLNNMSAFENHWHSVPLHILLHLHTISSITTSGSNILSNNSYPSSIIHPCPSWLLVSFFGSKYIFHTHFLIIGPHGMKHKSTLNLQGGSWPESTSPFLILNIWYLKSFTSQRAVCEAITTIFVS